MSVLFIDGKPSDGRRSFINFTNLETKLLPNFTDHIDDIISIFNTHCKKKTKCYFSQNIEVYEENSDSFRHSIENFKNLNKTLLWASKKYDIKWIYMSCGTYGVSPNGEGMTNIQYLSELSRNKALMRSLNRKNIKVFHPGSNNEHDILYENSFEWAPKIIHSNFYFIKQSDCKTYEWTSQETAMRLALETLK